MNKVATKNPTISTCSAPGNCNPCADKVLIWTVAGNVLLSVIKLIAGIWAESSGMVADGVQSFTCVVAGGLIMYCLVIARRPHDARYPYGYGKVEFVVALVIFSCLAGLGFFIFIKSFITILQRNFVVPEAWSLPVALLSAFLSYMMYRYNMCAGRRLQSAGLKANALQVKADMFSSAAVSVGIILAQFGPGFAIFDALAAVLVGVLIMKEAFHEWFVSVKALLDHAPEPGYRARVLEVVGEAAPGIRVGTIKIKRMGKQFWVGIGLISGTGETVGAVAKRQKALSKALREQIRWMGQVSFFLEGE